MQRKKRKSDLIVIVFTIMIFMLLLNACKANGQTDKDVSVQTETFHLQSETASPVSMAAVVQPTITPLPVTSESVTPSDSKKQVTSNNPASKQVTLLAVGDNLIHTQVIQSGLQKGRNYNYDHLYTQLKDEIKAADISVINQETVLGGSSLKYSGYPRFNSPTQIGDAVAKAGFDVVLQASNHTMDKGVTGISNTMKFWKKHPEISVLGINQSKKDQNTPKVIEKNGIKIAMLNYTFSLNGISLPKGKEYLVNLLDKEKMKKDIKRAKKTADVVIVFPHWGTEYVYKPDNRQNDLTKFFADQGVDIVIGSHPHVLEPMKWVKSKKGHKMLVYYSLGNYVSYQTESPRMLGGMAFLTLKKTGNKVSVSNASITPIVTHYEKTPNYNYGTYKLSDYTQKLAAKHGIIQKDKKSGFSLNYLRELSRKILGLYSSEW